MLPEPLLKTYKENLSFIICPVPGMDQKVLCRFIQGGYFERHLNKMRNIYRKKREVLVGELLRLNSDRIEIIGADAGLHILLKINNGMNEEQLVSSALKAGIKVYGLSRYYLEACDRNQPIVLLGYAALTEEEIKKAVRILDKAWF